MKYKIVLRLVFCVLFMSCKKYTQEQIMVNTVSDYFKKSENNYSINSVIPVNLTNSKTKDFFVYFNEVNKKTTEISKEKLGFVFSFGEKNNIELFKIIHYSFMGLFEDRYFNFKVDDSIPKIDEGIIFDFNKNGKDEVILFTLCGSVWEFDVYEYKDGKLSLICPSNLYGYSLDKLDFENKAMYLSDRESTEKIKLTWNPETEFYEKEILQE